MNQPFRIALALLLVTSCNFALADYVAVETINAVGSNYSATCVGQSSSTSGACSATYTAPLGTPPYTFNAQVSSSGDMAGLHASASSYIFADGGGTVVANAAEILADSLTFNSPVSSGFVSMTFTTAGTASNGQGDSVLKLNHLDASSCEFFNAGSCTVVLAVDFSQELFIDAALTAEASISVAPGFSASGFANFSDTGYVSALQFTDSNGNPVMVDYTSSSGLSYPMPQGVTGVPEPSSSELLLASLGGLGLMIHRRRLRR